MAGSRYLLQGMMEQEDTTHWEGMEGHCCLVFFAEAVWGPKVLQCLPLVHVKYDTAQAQHPGDFGCDPVCCSRSVCWGEQAGWSGYGPTELHQQAQTHGAAEAAAAGPSSCEGLVTVVRRGGSFGPSCTILAEDQIYLL